MKICYVLPSPTFGMHQYTADLAIRMLGLGHEVHVVTTQRAPLDRYPVDAVIHTPLETPDTGFSLHALRVGMVREVDRTVRSLRPDVVHFSGPHIWNPILLKIMAARRIPTVHTLHDLHPHVGTKYGSLLRVWNKGVQLSADGVLVHGECYRDEVRLDRLFATRVYFFPLTHLFVGWDHLQSLERDPPTISYESWALFFGRLETYKGLHVLAEAASIAESRTPNSAALVIAGKGSALESVSHRLPGNVTVLNQLVDDRSAVDLFARCGLVVLPYIEATQSALVAAAYYFRKPVLVTSVGALPEYVVDGDTGWVIPPNDPASLARVLGEALSHPDRLRLMGENGRAWYDRACRQADEALEALYEDVTHKRREAHGPSRSTLV